MHLIMLNSQPPVSTFLSMFFYSYIEIIDQVNDQNVLNTNRFKHMWILSTDTNKTFLLSRYIRNIITWPYKWELWFDRFLLYSDLSV